MCAQYGDCCPDKAAACDGTAACPPVAQPDPATCAGALQPSYGADGCVQGFVCVEDEAPCYVGGCSGQLCGDTEGMISTCEWKEEYACYKQDFAVCERQPDGSCGWTPNDDLLACIDDAAHACPLLACDVACAHGYEVDDHGCQTCTCKPAPDACAGHCGGKADAGCWCDEFCEGYGDCCPGKADVCP